MDGERFEELRRAAHDAPLAKIYETHTGHKFIGVHTDAWWKASQAYMQALDDARRPLPHSKEGGKP